MPQYLVFLQAILAALAKAPEALVIVENWVAVTAATIDQLRSLFGQEPLMFSASSECGASTDELDAEGRVCALQPFATGVADHVMGPTSRLRDLYAKLQAIAAALGVDLSDILKLLLLA